MLRIFDVSHWTVAFVVLAMKVGDGQTVGHNDYNTFPFLLYKRNVEAKSHNCLMHHYFCE